MSKEEKPNEDRLHPDADNAVSNHSGVPAEHLEHAETLFAILDKPTQRKLLVCTYITFLILGLYTAVRCLEYDIYAQAHHVAFEMHEWVYWLIFLPFCGATFNGLKYMLPGGKCSSCKAPRD